MRTEPLHLLLITTLALSLAGCGVTLIPTSSTPASTNNVLDATWQVISGNRLISGDGAITATAFAIDSNRLATAAHVVETIAEYMQDSDTTGFVVQHETGTTFTITRMWTHPDYDGNTIQSPDIGVLEIDGQLTSTLPLADNAALENLQVFDEIRMCSFPGDLTLAVEQDDHMLDSDYHPRATCLTGTISALRPFDPSELATFENSLLIQFSISTTRGTSGGAVYTTDGQVVAINSSATSDETGSNRFGTRIDTLRDLLNMIDEGTVEPRDLQEE